jgi:hypothetical protein
MPGPDSVLDASHHNIRGSNMKLRTSLVGAVTAIAMLCTPPAEAACDASQTNQTPISRYVINGGIVYDKKSDLTWQRCSVGQRWVDGVGCEGVIRNMAWTEAMEQAEGDWRVPTTDELLTLVSPSCKKPAVNEEAFPNMDLSKLWYWTGTPEGSSYAWFVVFDDASSSSSFRTYEMAVRLVKDGQ